VIKEILRKYNLRLNRDLGQHFLSDQNILRKIADTANLTKDDLVLEVGTGVGTLTKFLAEKAGFVESIELDRRLIPAAQEYLQGIGNYEISNEDIMKCKLPELLERYKDFKHKKVVANVPYYITTPLISLLIESKAKFETIVVTIQKEVAERIVSAPGRKSYGSFSIYVNYFTKPELIFHIPSTAFTPAPKVGSAVLKLTVLDKPSVKVKDEKLFFKIVHASFIQRRKMLHNSIINANIPGINKEMLDKAFEKAGIDRNLRGEALSINEFAKLSDNINIKAF
jgi:16S rRNA (adenine1518-N6/adenine1519-N6)-dimethyltransferase